MNIVSVDWDYFFPNTASFDWGHRESMLFVEAIWSMRAGNRDLITGEWALDVMRPRSQVKHFWDMLTNEPSHLIIAESHLTLLQVLNSIKCSINRMNDPVTVWNFDAHHDLGYGFTEDNCGNWALKAHEQGLLNEYKLIYPQWRFKEPENDSLPPAPDTLPFEYFYEPPEIDGVDVVFICRSSSWTPTWSDAAWIRFINYFKHEYPFLWEMKQYSDFAMRRRTPNMSQAKALRKEHEKLLEQMNVGA